MSDRNIEDFFKVFDCYQKLNEDYDEIDGKIILELDVLVIDPIRNIKAKLQKKIATDLKNYDIWLKQSKVTNEENSLFEIIDTDFKYVRFQCEINHSLQRITIVDFTDITNEVTSFNFDRFNQDASSSSNDYELPEDINIWNAEEVIFWLNICIVEFKLRKVKKRKWRFDGEQLLKINQNKLESLIECNKNEEFFKYFEHLRNSGNFNRDDISFFVKKSNKQEYKPPPILWKYILKCLECTDFKDCICWTNEETHEFRIINGDLFANYWSKEKGVKDVSFRSILRSLNYYCENGRMTRIKKTPNTFKILNFLNN